jgi:hypothetical protein
MPSPFPGMDPYLEAPDIWPDFSHSLVVGISRTLNRSLPRSYYSQTTFLSEINSVEIRDASKHELVPVIVIVSPSNKRGSRDCTWFLDKQGEILSTNVSLVQIHLLRHGRRLLAGNPALNRAAADHSYLIALNSSRQRLSWHLYPVGLRERLPIVPIPVDTLEVPLDLQFVVNKAYDEGPYWRGAVNYDRAPSPPLSDADAAWAAELIAAAFRRGE